MYNLTSPEKDFLMTNNIAGKQAENAARQFLHTNKLQFIDSNYSCRQGEIDLIMQDHEQLVFVEVKYRKNHYFGAGFDHVTPQKQQRIITTARHYLHTHKLTEKISCRFDVVSVEPAKNKSLNNFSFRWFKNAFV
jgi:putative endonuclease